MRAFLCQVLSRAQSASNLQTGRSAQQIWRSCIADLRRVSELDSKLAAMGRCTATFLQCQLLMDKVGEEDEQKDDWTNRPTGKGEGREEKTNGQTDRGEGREEEREGWADR